RWLCRPARPPPRGRAPDAPVRPGAQAPRRPPGGRPAMARRCRFPLGVLVLVLCAALVLVGVGWRPHSAPRQPGGHRAFAVSEELAKTAVLSLLGAAAGAALLVCLLDVLARRLYASMKRDNRFQLDEWLQDTAPSGKVCAKAVVMNRWFVGGHVPSSVPLPLAQKESPFVRGLRVTSRLAQAAADADAAAPQALTAWPANSVVVGTIRMGFGHHRIAYAATSWGLKRGAPTYFHDFLAIDSPEATLIKDQDKMYSRASRVASEWGGCVERIWGSFTKSQGDATLLRVSYQMAEHLKPLLLGIPKDTPIIASHSFVGLAAVACGFKKVINLVIDNHPQWFCVVPGALNLVQGPSNYHNFLRMGVPPSEIRPGAADAPPAAAPAAARAAPKIAACGTDAAANKRLYDEWGDRYERDVRAWGYRMPEVCAAALKRHAPDGERASFRVLDAGAGDGLSGKPS
ncbi:unnamed protein product, partial [Prorocentrum cordatum]